jgi:hypothetical protein
MTTVTPQDRRTKKRDWDDFFRFGQLMLGQQWVFAKTMPENPHHYTLRKHWEIDEEFAWAVAYLRANGYTAIFRKTRYIQINVNEHFCWTMGAPIHATILINRKIISNDMAIAFDVNADGYDDLQRSETIEVNHEVFDCIGSLVGKDILDVGCGTGRTWETVGDQLEASRYIGIDPSERMLHYFRRRQQIQGGCYNTRN